MHLIAKKHRNSDFWNTWNNNGVRVATSWGVDTLRTILHGHTKPDLNALLARVSSTAEDFKSLFPTDDDPEDVICRRNEELHPSFIPQPAN
jgi:hypothetical protein